MVGRQRARLDDLVDAVVGADGAAVVERRIVTAAHGMTTEPEAAGPVHLWAGLTPRR